MKGRDGQIVLEIEAVRIETMSARVEMELVASESSGLRDQPAHQAISMSLTSVSSTRHQIVDIEVVTPGQIVSEPEAGDPYYMITRVVEGTNQSVSLRTLNLVHTEREFLGRSEGGTKLGHGRMRQRRLLHPDLSYPRHRTTLAIPRLS